MKKFIVVIFLIILCTFFFNYCGDSDENITEDVKSIRDVGSDQDVFTSDTIMIETSCEGKNEGDYCKVGDSTGICIQLIGGPKCAKECMVIGIDEICEMGEGCYPLSSYRVCLNGGKRKTGESCAVVTDCIVGSVCLDGGDGFVCYKVCSSNFDCSNSEECIDTELGYNVCVGSQ